MSVATTLNLTKTDSHTAQTPAFEAAPQTNGQLKAVMTGITNENSGTSCASSSSTMTSGGTTNTTALKTLSSTATACATGDTFMCENGVPSDIVKTPVAYGKHAANLNLIGDNAGSTLHSCIQPIAAHITTSNAAHLLNDLSYAGDLHTKTSSPLQQSQQKVDQLQQQLQQTRLNDDARTLQLALELSLVGLNDEQNCFFEHQQKQQQQQQQQHAFALTSQQHQHTTSQLQKTEFDVGTLNAISAVIAANHSSHSNLFSSNSTSSLSGLLIPSNVLEDRSKKSQNMTECVPVPSSEHVAEIVGRQGCKIKALRAKTNTYIKTPVRGEEPVFVVTGRKEDVNKAKREILSAADHFSLIRATRKPSSVEANSHNVNHNVSGNGGTFANGTGAGNRGATSGPPSLPGQVTIQVRVPYRVVGLVVGPKGATIKHIQQETQTYIVTPSREKEPIFEVTGLPENVQTARKQIEAHIALRTGNAQNNGVGGGGNNNNNNALANLAKASEHLSELPNVHTINTLSQILNDDINSEFLASLYENGICSGLEYGEDALGVGHANINVGGVSAAMAPSSPQPPLNFNAATTTAGYPNGITAMIGNNRFQVQPQQQQQGIQAISSIISECSSGAPASVAVSNLQMQHENTIFHRSSNNDIKVRHEVQVIKNHGHITMHNNNVTVVASTNNGLTRSCSSASSTTSTNGTNNSAAGSSTNSNSPPELLNIWKNLGDSLDVDEGIGDSPNIWNLPPTLTALTGSHCSPNTSISPTDSLLGEMNAASANQQLQRQIATATATNNTNNTQLNNSSIILQDHQLLADMRAPLITGDRTLSMRRECFVCNEREVTTALVPCGHNMFCMDCANQICVSMDAICPVCNSIVYHAMRIIA